MTAIEVGRLLRAGVTGFIAGCRVSKSLEPSFGSLVRVPVEAGYDIYGIVHDINIEDDGLVRQLVTAEVLDEGIIADNRVNRNVPIEVSVLAVGYCQAGQVYHLLPPRPPLSLDLIYLCDPQEILHFTSHGRFGYFRHLIRAVELPVGELLAAHLKQARQAHLSAGDQDWFQKASQEVIVLLRDDYPLLMSVLGALSEVEGLIGGSGNGSI
jgi:hypothetical protein